MGFIRTIVQRVRFEPVVVTGVIVSAALLFGYELDAEEVGSGVAGVFEWGTVLAPVVTGLIARFRTRSKASLAAEAEPGDGPLWVDSESGHGNVGTILQAAVGVLVVVLLVVVIIKIV